MKKNIFLLSTDTCYGIACSVDDVRSYEKIYKIKKRNFLKPLAIMVENLQWLEDNTDLNEEQIIDLKEYPHPFTIICQSSVIQALLQFDDEKHFYKNKDVYEKIAFRVAHTSDQTKLLKKVGPIFLTSANYTGQYEIFNYKYLKEVFSEYSHIVEYLSKEDLNPNQKSSDIFEYIGESTEKKYLRKNS